MRGLSVCQVDTTPDSTVHSCCAAGATQLCDVNTAAERDFRDACVLTLVTTGWMDGWICVYIQTDLTLCVNCACSD